MIESTPYTQITESVQIDVFPSYIEEQSDPLKGLFFFAYKVRITNQGEDTCQLHNRHWIIRNGKGQEEHVKGEGVVGQKPVLHPGETFEYTSFCPMNTPTGNMRGRFEMTSEGATGPHRFWVAVPVFFLRRPNTFH
jgi:ApaG protein